MVRAVARSFLILQPLLGRHACEFRLGCPSSSAGQLSMPVLHARLFRSSAEVKYGAKVASRSSDVNRVELVGTISDDVVLRPLPKGLFVATVKIEVESGRNPPDCIPVEVWGSVAQRAEEMKKGTKVEVQGRLKSDTYVGKTRGTHSSIKVVARSLTPLGGASIPVEEHAVAPVGEWPPADWLTAPDAAERLPKRHAQKLITDQLDTDEPHTFDVTPTAPSPAPKTAASRKSGGWTGRYKQKSASGKGASVSGKTASLDTKWTVYFEHPGDWWDNRHDKRNPKAPDFKHKSNGEALWLNNAPSWVVERLQQAGGGGGHATGANLADDNMGGIPF